MSFKRGQKVLFTHYGQNKNIKFFYHVPLYIFLLIISSDCATLFQSHIRTALDSVVYKHTTEIYSSDCFQANPGTHWTHSLTCHTHTALVLWAETVKLFSGERKFLNLPVMLIFNFYTRLSKWQFLEQKAQNDMN